LRELTFFDGLLRDLVEDLNEPHTPGSNGRPPIPLREQAFCTVKKLHSQLSSRRAHGLYDRAAQDGHIQRAPGFNTVSRFLNREDAASILRDLIRRSALPLAALDHTFAVDSTGFRSTTFSAYYGAKHGKDLPDSWVKAHICCGVKTHIVADAIITDVVGEGTGDSPNFRPLVESTAKGFRVLEVVADKAYSSKDNLWAIKELGGEAFIPFKRGRITPGAFRSGSGHGVPGKHGSGRLWRQAYHYFQANPEMFYARYHQRSNVESVNAAIKRKFGETLKSKTLRAQQNEVLAKILAYNLTVLIHEMHEHGVQPSFETE
jgi:hypothetical protein